LLAGLLLPVAGCQGFSGEQKGAATQKMVGSITHDAQLEDYNSPRYAYSARENLMTGDNAASSRLEEYKAPAPRPRATMAPVPAAEPAPAPVDIPLPPPTNQTFQHAGVNPFVNTEDDALSTFAVDVDTASYAVARKHIEEGYVPPAAAVRVEEFINYFKQEYEAPTTQAFAIQMEGAPSPFGGGPGYYLMRVGVQGREIGKDDRRAMALVFLVDISGSMATNNRYLTVRQSLDILVNQLNPEDMAGIVAYDDRAEIRLEPTSARDKERILSEIYKLSPRGSTNVEAGLKEAYKMAGSMMSADRTARIILCADGVANTGLTDPDRLLDNMRGYIQDGVALTAIGVGLGNYNDVLMEKIANTGDGNYFYIDDVEEAKRVFAQNLSSTLETIAKDAKIQVEFNPESVDRYRLLGYENRAVADKDFRNNAVDAGEIGAGHSVTALYELQINPAAEGTGWKLAEARLRWQDPDTGNVQELNREFSRHDVLKTFHEASPRFQLNAVVAEYAEILRGSHWVQSRTLDDVAGLAEGLARGALSSDPDVKEFAALVAKAATFKRQGRVYEEMPNGQYRRPITQAEQARINLMTHQ
jgi:Ca-activated chloride channel family protein